MNGVTNSTRSFYLSEALYYNPETIAGGFLKKSLDEYQVLLLSVENTIEAIKSRQFIKFDPVVGENACHIRAVYIAEKVTEYFDDLQSWKQLVDLETRVNSAKSALQQLLISKDVHQLSCQKKSFATVLEERGLHIQLTADEMFLFLSFFLTEMTETARNDSKVFDTLNSRDKVAPRNFSLKESSGVSSKFLFKTARKMRTLLAEASIAWVQQISNKSADPSLRKMLSKEFTKEHNELPTLPTFWVCKMLLQSAREKKVPIMLSVECVIQEESHYRIVDEERFLFEVPDGKDEYVHVQHQSQTDSPRCVCMIGGEVRIDLWKDKNEWREKFLSYGLEQKILACAANHRQYLDSADAALIDNIDERDYHEYNSLAAKEGFSLDNPKLFFIHHFYPMTLGKTLP